MDKLHSSPVQDIRHQAEDESRHDPAPDGLRYTTAPLLPVRLTAAGRQMRQNGKEHDPSYERVVSEWWWI